MHLMVTPDGSKFQVCSNAGNSGRFEVGTDTLSVRVGQRMRRGNQEEMWDSVLVQCKEHPDGSIAVEAVVCHPDWNEPMEIASIQSHPQDREAKKPT